MNQLQMDSISDCGLAQIVLVPRPRPRESEVREALVEIFSRTRDEDEYGDDSSFVFLKSEIQNLQFLNYWLLKPET